MRKIIASAIVAAGLMASPAEAVIVDFQVLMDGLQEVPPVATPGSGFATVQLNTDTNTVTLISGSYQNLLTNVIAAHIHGLAPPGVNAGVIVGLTHTGGTSGTLSLPGGFVLTDAQETGMLAGLTYINVHTTAFPGGEIRGQLLIIPAPGALALLGAAALLGTRRRR